MRGMLKPLQSAPGFKAWSGAGKQLYAPVGDRSFRFPEELPAGRVGRKVKPLPLLVVTPGERDAGIIAEELIELLPGIAVRQFPVLQLLPYQVLAQSKELVAQRLQVLEGLARENA